MPEYWYLSASRRLQLGPLGKYQEYLKTVEDLPGTLTPENIVILRPLMQSTTGGRDYLCIKSPLKIKSLANGTVRKGLLAMTEQAGQCGAQVQLADDDIMPLSIIK